MPCSLILIVEHLPCQPESDFESLARQTINHRSFPLSPVRPHLEDFYGDCRSAQRQFDGTSLEAPHKVELRSLQRCALERDGDVRSWDEKRNFDPSWLARDSMLDPASGHQSGGLVRGERPLEAIGLQLLNCGWPRSARCVGAGRSAILPPASLALRWHRFHLRLWLPCCETVFQTA